MEMKLPEPLTPIAYPKTLEELEALRVFHKRNIRPVMAAIHAMIPGAHHNSPSRSVMVTQHLPQHLIVSGSEAPIVMSGLEYEMGKYTFATRLPYNGTIRKIIPRYTTSLLAGTNSNVTPDDLRAQITLIYQKEANGEYDVIDLFKYQSYHQHFGFSNKFFNLEKLYPGSMLPGGTKFTDTPANLEGELYTYGVNFSTACMDIPGVAEDGVIIARSALKKLRIKVIEQREITFGRNNIPMNLFGKDGEYKIFKDIGENIRTDGLIMATRSYRDFMGPAYLSQKDLKEVNYIFDEKLYSRETSIDPIMVEERERAIMNGQFYNLVGGKVIDIKVIKSNDTQRWLPPTMTAQLDRYAQAYKDYYESLLEFETEKTVELKRMDRDAKLRIHPSLQNKLVRARAITGKTGNRFQGNVGFQYRRNQLDEYTVYFTIEHELEPREGWKVTSINGDKGVIVQIWEDEWMPVDKAGNRAEIICSSNSTVARSNWGRTFTPYFAASARDVRKKLLSMFGNQKVTEEAVELLDDKQFNDMYNLLLFFYAIVSPRQYYYYTQVVVKREDRNVHMYKCLKDKVQVMMMIDNPIDDVDAVLHLEKHFPQVYDTVVYRGVGGNYVETTDRVRIAPMYFMLLEKIADDGSSANIGKLQIHGLLASQTKAEKYAQNYRTNHTRNTGEAEARLIAFYAKTVEAIAELHDRNNNPETMRHMGRKILRHDTPTNIDEVVDRNVIELDGTRPLQFLQHFMFTQGARISYITEEEAFKLGQREIFHAK